MTAKHFWSRRQFLQTAGMVAGGSLLAACVAPTAAPAPASEGDASGAAPEDIALTYLMWQLFPDQPEAEQTLIADPFMEENPGVTVDLTFVPGFAEYNQRLNTLYAADTPPDVFGISVAVIWDFANLGLVADLQPLLDRDINADDYYLNIAQPDRFPQPDGPLHAFPFQWVCSVLYYNKDMFDAAEVAYPDESWTYDTLLEAATALTDEEEGYWGFDSSPAHTFLDAMIMAYGGKVLDDDYTTCLLGEAVPTERIQWAVDLIQEHGVAPSARVAKEAGLSAAGSAFSSGRIGMAIDGSWAISNMMAGATFNWDMAMVPAGPEERFIYGGPDQYTIAAASEHKDMAWQYLLRSVGPDRPLESFSAGAVPFYRPKATSEEWLSRADQNLQVILDTAPYIVGAYFGHNWSKWRIDAMNGILGTAFIGESTVPDAIAEACTEIDRILAEPF